MNIEPDTSNRQSLLDILEESRSFRRNPINCSIFYVTAVATMIMFIILVSLSVWSVILGNKISALAEQSSETLADVQEIIPNIHESLKLLKTMCQHENFTRNYGNI